MSDSEHTLIVGVDGGGTGCRVAIGTLERGILARAEGGPANAASDPEQAAKNIISTVNAAAARAEIAPSALKFASAHLGLAGIMTDKDSARMAARLPFEKSVVTDDRPTAVTGALGGQDGFLLSIGTGTIVAASLNGSHSYIGGWGFQVSDQGSGAWLGREALEQVLLCHDAMADHTDLTRTLFAKFSDDPNAIVAFSKSADPSDFGSFAPDVVSAAKSGDACGQLIMATGAYYLTRALTTLGLQAGNAICLTGGVGPHFAQFLSQDMLGGQIASKGNALDGAFELAKAGITQQQGEHR